MMSFLREFFGICLRTLPGSLKIHADSLARSFMQGTCYSGLEAPSRCDGKAPVPSFWYLYNSSDSL